MQTIKRVLVALDMTAMDESIISYTSFLSDILKFDSIYFFHVAKSLMLPKGIKEKYADLLAPVDESLEDLIKDKVNQFYHGNADINIEIREGNPYDRILRWSDIKEIDLIITGKKEKLKGSGVLPNKLAKIGHCSILTVREDSVPQMQKIITPVDFSSSSKTALHAATALAEVTKAKLLIQNTYVVPSGYHKSGKTYEEFAKIIKKHSKNEAEEFLQTAGLENIDHEVILSLDDDDEPSDKIYADALHYEADLIVIGSKGRTELASILLGSVADKLLHYQGNIPVLVVKDKKENMGFIEALLRI